MDNSNIIISVIIVLCIAAGVTAYGISEGDNAVFTDLSGFSPDSSSSGDNGIGNASAQNNANDGLGSLISAPSDSGGNSGGSNGGSSSGSGGNSGGSNGGSSSGSGGNSGGSGTNDNGGDSGGDSQQDIGYDACFEKAKSLADGASFVSSSEDGDYRIFYFSKTMPESEQSNYTTDTFGISVNKYTGVASLY